MNGCALCGAQGFRLTDGLCTECRACTSRPQTFDQAIDRLLAKARPIKRRAWRCRWSNR